MAVRQSRPRVMTGLSVSLIRLRSDPHEAGPRHDEKSACHRYAEFRGGDQGVKTAINWHDAGLSLREYSGDVLIGRLQARWEMSPLTCI